MGKNAEKSVKMPKKVRAAKSDVAFIERWIKTVAENKSISPKKIIEESLAVKTKAIQIFEEMAGVDKRNREPSDPFIAGIVKVLQENEYEARDEILKLVYEGEVDPMAYYEAVMKIMKAHSPVAHAFQDLRKVNVRAIDVKAAKGCPACAACAGCALCAACGITGTIAAGAAGMAGAAGAYFA